MADMVLGPDGFSYNGSTSNANIGQPFYRRAGSNTNYGLNSSWQNCFQSPDWSIPKKSQLVMNFRVPIRNDNNGWGGAYVRPYYRVNSGGWIDCGNAGYTTCMGYGKRMISGHDHMQTFDFTGKTSDFTLGFLIQCRTYDSSANTGGSHNLEGADGTAQTDTGTSVPWRWYMTINGWTRP